MNTFFEILFALSFVGLAVGLVKPQWVRMPSRKHAALVFLGAAFVFAILGSPTAFTLSGFFSLLALVAFAGLIIGYKHPSRVKLSSSKQVGYVFGGALALSLILLATTLPPESQRVTTTSAPAVPAAPATPQDKLKAIVAGVLQGTTNDSNENHLRSDDVTADPQGGWDVSVAFNGDDNLTENLTKQGVEEQMSKVYIALYTSGLDVSSVSVEGFLQLTDKFGNTKDGMVYESSLDKATASQVNWQADSALLDLNILPGVWHTDYDLFAADPNL